MSSVKLRFIDKQFDVQYDPAKVKVEAMLALIKKEGFEGALKKTTPLK